ncbi:hypothetical protein FZEAL_807 [Fusarium zealandicum]|uniref:Heterokaryon incompatibility domain-containing protein n=1 Tax=Fusarium zealandicum TaxID=1053134 RepID=A0A8H4UUE3_9HYPO|nr:hypothetical protein FZEAL_807 [Fusarium zealandicum]
MEHQQNFAFSYSDHVLPSTATHIRLVRLHPSIPSTASESGDLHFSSRLSCDLVITPISKPGAYKALSYTWGTSQRPSSLDISGTSFPITSALDAALRYIRSRQEPIVLWVDQICIDQENSAEKEAQVLLMSDVYTKAEQVLVWLGPEADRSDKLMDMWQNVGQRARDLGIEEYFTRERMLELQAVMADPLLEHALARPCHGLIDMASPWFEDLLHAIVHWNERPWFHRVWTVQELCLCSNTVFICGYKTVQVELVWLACTVMSAATRKSIRSHPHTDTEFMELAYKAECHRTGPLMSIQHRRQNFSKNLGTGDELFHLFRKLFVEGDTMATRNRDRIYGLLGLAIDSEKLGIKPDYTSDDPSTIFTSVARRMIQSGRVEMLSFSQFPKEDGLKHLPSWVPDWRPMLVPSYYTITESAENHLLAASGDKKVHVETVQDSDVLGIGGYLVDTVEEVGETWHYGDPHPITHGILKGTWLLS